MIFTANKQTIVAALSRLSGVVARKSTIPIISHVLINAHKSGKVVFSATNMDMEATVTILAAVQAPGKTTAPGDMLAQIAKNAADGAEINFELGDRLKIKSGRSRFNLATLPAANFPAFSDIAEPQTIETTCDVIGPYFSRVAFAASVDQSRYVLTGVLLFASRGRLGSTASNGHKVAFLDTDFAVDAEFSVIVPPFMAAEIAKAVAGSTAPCKLLIAQGKIRLEAGDLVITSKLIDGSFPDIKRIIPRDLPHKLTVDEVEFAAAINRVAISADGKTRSVKTEIGDGRIVCSAHGTESDATDEVEADIEGVDIVMGFNLQYLLECIDAPGSERVEIAYGGAEYPVIIRRPDDVEFLTVIAPVRV